MSKLTVTHKHETKEEVEVTFPLYYHSWDSVESSYWEHWVRIDEKSNTYWRSHPYVQLTKRNKNEWEIETGFYDMATSYDYFEKSHDWGKSNANEFQAAVAEMRQLIDEACPEPKRGAEEFTQDKGPNGTA